MDQAVMCKIDQMENGKDLKGEKRWYLNEFKHCHKNNMNKILKRKKERKSYEVS